VDPLSRKTLKDGEEDGRLASESTNTELDYARLMQNDG
jgi:hypothetical protein